MTTGFPGMGAMGFPGMGTMGFPGVGTTPGFGPTVGMGGFTLPYGSLHCPACGYSGPVWHSGVSPSMTWGGFAPSPYLMGGLGGLRRWGGSYSPQYLTTGLPTDEEVEEMVYDAFDADPLIPWDADIEVESNAGVLTLRGDVPSKTIKHAVGNDAWWVPGVDDVRNELTVTGRRRVRAAGGRPAAETAPTPTRPTTARRPAATTTRSAAPSGARAAGAGPMRPRPATTRAGGPTTRPRTGTTGTTGGTSQTA